MTQELIPIKLEKIMQTRSYSVVMLKAKDASRFAIYTDGEVGKIMQMYLMGTLKERPLTHDMISNLFKGLGVRLKQIVINDVKENIYFARLYVEMQDGDLIKIVEIDARPSDCIALAILNNVPLYCTQGLLEKTVKISHDEKDFE